MAYTQISSDAQNEAYSKELKATMDEAMFQIQSTGGLIPCGKCEIQKPRKEYPNRGPKELRSNCIRCRRILRDAAHKRRKATENRSNILAYKRTHPCEHCAESDPVVLHFHHLRDKLGTVSMMAGRGIDWSRISSEIDKCIVLCANCHLKEHDREGYSRNKS